MKPLTSARFAGRGTCKGALALMEPDPGVRDALSLLLRGAGWRVFTASESRGLRAVVGAGGVAAVISDYDMPGDDAHDFLEMCLNRGVPLVFTGNGVPVQHAVDVIRRGAADFLDKPFPQSRLMGLLDRLSSGSPMAGFRLPAHCYDRPNRR